MILEFSFQSCHSIEWPAVKIVVNGTIVRQTDPGQELTVLAVDCVLDQDHNSVVIEYFNKRPEHTILENGEIRHDQNLKLIDMRFDDILVEPWVWQQGVYKPRYFQGYVERQSSLPAEIRGDCHWYFPGVYCIGPWPHDDKFWWWYRDTRRQMILDHLQTIDSDREDSHMGSLSSYQDEIDKIKRIIDV